MISAPRTPPPPCPLGCSCNVCGDDLVRSWADDAQQVRRSPDEWRAVDEQPRQKAASHVPDLTPRPMNFDGFEQDVERFDRDMAALHERLRGGTP